MQVHRINLVLIFSMLSMLSFSCSDVSEQTTPDTWADGYSEDTWADGYSDSLETLDAQEDLENHDSVEVIPQETEALFLQGCPEPGFATAMEITNPDLKMTGPDAVGGLGDFLLMNEKAAFIIEAPQHTNAYYIFGGILVDAVALNGCSQASPERFEELGFLLGSLNAANYLSSILRCFKGEYAEIINDGSNGEAAVLRVTGTDDFFWLIELEFIRVSLFKGEDKYLSDPYDLEITVDYILEPGAEVLQVEVNIKNRKEEEMVIVSGAEMMFGDTTQITYFSDAVLEISGYRLELGIPWMMAGRGDGAWAVARKDSEMIGANISGVNVLFDFNEVIVSPLVLGPAGSEYDSSTSEYLVSVGATDPDSAFANLQPYNPEPLPGKSYTLASIDGKVTDAQSGDAIKGARVDLMAENSDGDWQILNSYYSYDEGIFAGSIPDFGYKTPNYQLIATLDGRTPSEPVEVSLDKSEIYMLEIDPAGYLNPDITDENGAVIPAKILVYKDGILIKWIFHVPGDEPTPMPAGDYQFSVSRGFEYDVLEGDVSIAANETTTIQISLTRMVDTTGYLSVDTHCHAGPSTDNTILIPERIRTVAAEGLEVVVSTDHEAVSDWSYGVTETGLESWVGTVIGQEVTAALPNHSNAYPLELRMDIDARGGYVKWFGLDIAQIFAAERERGAAIVQFNHPRGDNYLSVIGYDRITGGPTMTDPTRIGLSQDAALWSWDFDTVEYMNGPDYVFIKPGKPDVTGLFDDWMSFLNLGHPKTAVGVSDTHNYGTPGRPRNYFISSTDEPSQFSEEEMVTALKEGRTLVSVGAFARVMVNSEANMGDTITDQDGEIDLYVHIEAIPQIDITYFKVYVNCDQILAIPADDPDGIVKFDGEISVPIERDSHVVVLGFGENPIPAALGNYNPVGTPRFTTNAIFIDYDGNGKYDAPGGKLCDYDIDPPQE